MSAINLLTNDSYFRSGFEILVDGISSNITRPVLIMDDGVEFLYFIDADYRGGRIPPMSEFVDFFIERVKLVVPKNTSYEKLLHIIKTYCGGAYLHISLTPRERYVLRKMAHRISSNISPARMGMNYKTWHSFKNSAFRRLGIKNTVTFMRAIHAWRSTGYSSVFKRFIRSPACPNTAAHLRP